MDLDALFARPDESLEKLLDPCFDLHVTHDFGRWIFVSHSKLKLWDILGICWVFQYHKNSTYV